jgi:fibronectin type 3 domain-containing protein
MDLQKSTTNPYQLFQISLFLLIIAACSSAGSMPISETTTPTSEAAALSWNASAGPDIAGYKIYQATASGAYDAPIATVPRDVITYTVTGLETGTTYFFTVTAYNLNGTESSFSNEVSKAIL